MQNTTFTMQINVPTCYILPLAGTHNKARQSELQDFREIQENKLSQSPFSVSWLLSGSTPPFGETILKVAVSGSDLSSTPAPLSHWHIPYLDRWAVKGKRSSVYWGRIHSFQESLAQKGLSLEDQGEFFTALSSLTDSAWILHLGSWDWCCNLTSSPPTLSPCCHSRSRSWYCFPDFWEKLPMTIGKYSKLTSDTIQALFCSAKDGLAQKLYIFFCSCI